MRNPPSPPRESWGAVATYGAALAVYVAIGVAEPRFLLNSIVGIGFCIVAVAVVPALVRGLIARLRARAIGGGATRGSEP